MDGTHGPLDLRRDLQSVCRDCTFFTPSIGGKKRESLPCQFLPLAHHWLGLVPIGNYPFSTPQHLHITLVCPCRKPELRVSVACSLSQEQNRWGTRLEMQMEESEKQPSPSHQEAQSLLQASHSWEGVQAWGTEAIAMGTPSFYCYGIIWSYMDPDEPNMETIQALNSSQRPKESSSIPRWSLEEHDPRSAGPP